MARGRKHSPDFRKAETSYVMRRWKSTDSCSLVGIGSVGKSNLLNHLTDEDTLRYYWGDDFHPHTFKPVIIDPNMLGPLPPEDNIPLRCWSGYELMMHRLFMAFYPFEMLTDEEANRFYDIYQALQDGNNPLHPYMALRYFELGVDMFMRRGVKIVFMFDEFEEMLRHLPIKFFLTLRGLRDINKRQLCYLTFTRAPLSVLVDRFGINALEVEPFVELFNDGMYYVGPYDETDGRNMVNDLMRRNDKTYPEATVDFLMRSTGRYAGMMRAGFHQLEPMNLNIVTPDMEDQITQQLATRAPIRTECRTVWKSLTPAEQYVLKAAARLEQYNINKDTEQAVNMLVHKRLLRIDRVNNHQLIIEPPVFRAFVATNPDVE